MAFAKGVRRKAPATCARSSCARQRPTCAVAPRDHQPLSHSVVSLLAAALLSSNPALPAAALDMTLPPSMMSVVGMAPAAAATYSLDDDDPTLPTGVATGFIADALFPGVDFPVLFPELLPEGFLPTDATRENPESLPDIIGPGMRLLICGLNPSVYSAETLVGFGRPGNRFWPAALAAGKAALGTVNE